MIAALVTVGVMLLVIVGLVAAELIWPSPDPEVPVCYRTPRQCPNDSCGPVYRA